VFESAADEPLSAMAWNKTQGLYVKPMSERGYTLTQCPFYPMLLSYFSNRDAVLGVMFKALVEAASISPSPELYKEFERVLSQP